MKIVFPELTTNPTVKEACQSFPDTEFIPADNLDHAAKVLKDNHADSIITGIDYSTRDVILAFKEHIPLKTDYFSSCFICEKNDQILAIADGGVIKQPTKEQLFTITEDTAKTFQTFTGEQPRIAMLSYSTYGSGGKNPDLEKIDFVIAKIKQTHPDWLTDGEMQLDAAVNPQVANKKTPNSPLQGSANILITPDLNSGNILYKSLEQFGGYTIAGPIIQGFTIPLADLSRGSTVKDIILTIKVILKQLKKE